MKKRRILVHGIFWVLILLSLVLFCFETQRQYRIDSERDDIFGGSFTVFCCLVAFFPVFSFEIELYRVVRYFALCARKTRKKTIINLISLCFLPVLFLGVTILHFLTFDASAAILSGVFLLTPLHFLIMRMVAWNWWCQQIEREEP